MYRIIITKLEPNSAFDEWEKKRVGLAGFSYSSPPEPPQFLEPQHLETVVNDEEFKRIRDACLKEM